MGMSDRYYQPPDLFAPDPVGDECPGCGGPVADDIWCPECGAVLDPEEAAAEERFAAEAEKGEPDYGW